MGETHLGLAELLQRPLPGLDRWLEPAPDLVQAGDRRRARLLAGLLLVLFPAGLGASILVPGLTNGGYESNEMASLAVGILFSLPLLPAYFVSRTRHYRWAASFLVLVSVIGTWAAVMAQPSAPERYHATFFFAIPIFLSGLVLPIAITAIVATTVTASVFFVPLFDSSIGLGNMAIQAVFLVFLSVLTLAGVAIRRADLEQIQSQATRIDKGRQRYRSLFEAAFEGLVVHDDGQIVEANQAFTRMIGLDSAALVTQPLGQYLVADETGPAENVDRAVCSITEDPVEARLFGSDGRPMAVEIVSKPHEQEGRTLWLTAVRDIEARKAAERAQRADEEHFRTFAEAAMEGLVIHDHGTILQANPAFAQMFGYELDDLRGMHVLELVAPEALDEVRRRLREPRGEAYEISAQRKNGSTFIAEVRATDVTYQGRSARVTAVRDVSLQRQAEAARAQSLAHRMEVERLREVDSFRTTLLNTASHELNTPITPLRLQAHLLRSGSLGTLNTRQEKAVGVLSRNIDRLAALVRDMLDIARLEGGRLRIDPEHFDLAATSIEAIETFSEAAKNAGVRLEAEIPDPLPVLADPQRISQVLYNLLSNAIKFTPPGGDVKISAHGTAEEAVLEVRDSGIGIPIEARDQLFEPFSQINDAVRPDAGGSGLGLYICKGIIDHHSGTIECESAGAGAGTTMRVRIPRGLAATQQSTDDGGPLAARPWAARSMVDTSTHRDD